MEARTVAKIIVEEFIARCGVPYSIHSDQGRQFESLLFQEMCSLLQIEKTHTTPYHPQSDGMVERFNRTLLKMMSIYLNERHTDWDEKLPYVMLAYRSSEHEIAGHSPNFLMLGQETATPLDIMY
jgi:transposase InsO family protein